MSYILINCLNVENLNSKQGRRPKSECLRDALALSLEVCRPSLDNYYW